MEEAKQYKRRGRLPKIERRDRTIHKRMREYLYELTHSDDFDTVILPVGDGVALSYAKGV